MSVTPLVPNAIGAEKFPFLSNVEHGITAHAGGGQTNAYQLGAQVNVVSTVASGNDSVKLPKIVANPGRLDTGGCSVGTMILVCNNSATTMKVYGADPDTINAVATGTGVTVAGGVNVWMVAYDYTTSTDVGRWRMTNSQAAAVAAITSGTISGFTISDLTINSFVQGAPAAKTTTTTLTAAEVAGGLITANQGAAGTATYTFPLGTDLTTQVGSSCAVGSAFFFRAVNISTVAAEDVTFVGNTGTTLVGSGAMASNAAATDLSFATFLIRRTGTNTYSIYRVG